MLHMFSNLWSESISDRQIVRRICSLNKAFWEKMIAL